MVDRMKRVPKGWGYELWIVNSDLYCGKLLHFDAGKRCALHWHENKDETFFVNAGKILVHHCDSPEAYEQLGQEGGAMKATLVEAGNSYYVPPRKVHLIEALEDADVFEFSTFHEDEDSYFIHPGDEVDMGVADVDPKLRALNVGFSQPD
ncbi:cupin domain-containing protein [Rhodovibrionaceae bacterium A322]